MKKRTKEKENMGYAKKERKEVYYVCEKAKQMLEGIEIKGDNLI